MGKREVSKESMIHLIETESPIFRNLDQDGLMYLTGPKYDFIYTPFGQIIAKSTRTGIQYTCYAHEFTIMYDGICAERDFI